MGMVSVQQQKKIHPLKFIMWVAMASIVMMFAGLTSAYIIKSNQASWQEIKMPQLFWFSTGAILISSITIQMAVSSFKKGVLNKYRQLLGVTSVLGIVFVVLQLLGFQQLWDSGIQFRGVAGAGQFLYVVFGLHIVHVLGGIIALLIMAIQTIFFRTKTRTSISIEVAATYWHFVDLLWLYIIIFFLLIG